MSVLPDVLAPDLDIVFCGTAVGEVSARRQAYYAGPGNAFWPTLHKVGLTPYLLKPEQYREILRWKIGLTDVAKDIFGKDSNLAAADFDRVRLAKLVSVNCPRILAFTSKRAAAEFFGHPADYGLARGTIGKTMVFVLPSPSGSARRYWDVGYWHELACLRDAKMSDRTAVYPVPPQQSVK